LPLSLVLRAFPTHFGCILYFTTLKSIFSIIHTHFYITTHIPFSTLQSIILKYYKIIFFYIFFFSVQPNQRHPSKPREPINHNLNNPINSPDQQPSTAQINNPLTPPQPRQPPITPTPIPANPNPPQPISIKINKITNRTQPQPCYPAVAKESIGEAESVRQFFDCGFTRSPQLRSAHAGPAPRRSPSSQPQGHRDLLAHEKLDRPKKQEIQKERRAEQSRERASVPREKERKEENKKRGERGERRQKTE
jgi:hypothetical protein